MNFSSKFLLCSDTDNETYCKEVLSKIDDSFTIKLIYIPYDANKNRVCVNQYSATYKQYCYSEPTLLIKDSNLCVSFEQECSDNLISSGTYNLTISIDNNSYSE